MQRTLAESLTLAASQNYNELQEGTRSLQYFETIPGYPLELLKLLVTMTPSTNAYETTVIQYKNFIIKHWDDVKSQHLLSEEMRDNIKSAMVQLYFSSNDRCRKYLIVAARCISEKDLPRFWPSFFDDIKPYLNGENIDQKANAFNFLHKCMKKYRYSYANKEVMEELIYILQQIDNLMMTTFQTCVGQLQSCATDTVMFTKMFKIILPITQLFHTLITHDIPQLFSDHLSKWIDNFSLILQVDSNAQTAETLLPEKASVIVKTQTEVIDTLILLVDRYQKDIQNNVPSLTGLIWRLKGSLSDNDVKKEKLAVNALRFLVSCAVGQFSVIFRNTDIITQIFRDIIIPNLAIAELELNDFVYNPLNFVALDLETWAELRSKRYVCVDLLRALMNVSQQWAKETQTDFVLDLVVKEVTSLTEAYAADPINRWSSKVAAILLLSAFCAKTHSFTRGVSQVNHLNVVHGFIAQHILPALTTPLEQRPADAPAITSEQLIRLQLVRSQEIKFLFFFREWLPPDQYTNVLQILIQNCLVSPHVVIHTYAACTIEKILLLRSKNGLIIKRETLHGILPTLLDLMFRWIHPEGGEDNEYVMKALSTVINQSRSLIVEKAGVVLDSLSAILSRVMQAPQKPRFNHFMFEALAALIRNVCLENASRVNIFTEKLTPSFGFILSKVPVKTPSTAPGATGAATPATGTAAESTTLKVPEFVPYVVQLFCLIVRFDVTITPTLSSLITLFLNQQMWEYEGYIPPLTRLLSIVTSKFSSYFFNPQDPKLQETPLSGQSTAEQFVNPIIQIVNKLIQSPSQDLYAFQLLDALTKTLSTPLSAALPGASSSTMPSTGILPSAPGTSASASSGATDHATKLEKMRPFVPGKPDENPLFHKLVSPHMVGICRVLLSRFKKVTPTRLLGRTAQWIGLLMYRRGIQYPIDLFEAAQPGSFMLVLQQWVDKANSFQNHFEIKCSVYGLLCLMTEYPVMMQQLALWDKIFNSCYSIFNVDQMPIWNLDTLEEEEEEETKMQKGYDVPYSPLVFAKTRDDRMIDPMPCFAPVRTCFALKIQAFLLANPQFAQTIYPQTQQNIQKLLQDCNLVPKTAAPATAPTTMQ
ncbi:putative Exportin-2 [Monocercomonoides exilis]|uniref:putative Exportin-2 n=1 Tax=Monocercomonoides exilis TaxID=2049356 RepID=UPI003559B104|nr:putative Exportin-2 [Monocercomonoides exilis]|eukprot:MONOS_11263.1-p1 / transcript=MONOS_11263.1 / gene=MONOS_11263 / organism=Monocercomonoides_exilis_PA203 / gene_product=Exportin-2 / transcript_product=Exportin-2 / location=Mono_scaffold00555:27640-32723(+) / protein_length=1102 / sequence_SO=supercontig / SO=protein_coding / is_pseudo=false